MVKLAKNKWVVFLVLIVAIVVFDSIVYNVALNDRGLVIGVGVELEGEYIVISTQILLQKNGGISSGDSKYMVLTAKAKTVKQAYDEISERLGMTLSLAHTMTILVSKEVFTERKEYLIKDFFTDDEISDIASVVVADGSPKALLESTIPFGETASLQMQRILKNVKKPIGITSITLKDYLVNYCEPYSACVLPLVHSIESAPNSSQNPQEGEYKQLVINRTAVISQSGEVFYLEGEANEGLSLIRQPIHDGTVTIVGDDGYPISVSIIETGAKSNYDIRNMTVTYELDIKCVRGAGRIDEKGRMSYLMSDSERGRFLEAIDGRIKAAFDKALEHDTDFLLIYKGFYQAHGKKWTDIVAKNYLSQITIKTKLKTINR